MYTIIEKNTEIVEFEISSGDSYESGSGEFDGSGASFLPVVSISQTYKSGSGDGEPFDSFQQLTTQTPDAPVSCNNCIELTTNQILGIVLGTLAGLSVLALIMIMCIRNTKSKYDVTKTRSMKQSNSKPSDI